MMSLKDKLFYTDKDLCEALEVDRRTLHRWREKRLISFIRTPTGKIRYTREHIEEWIRRNQKLMRGKAA